MTQRVAHEAGGKPSRGRFSRDHGVLLGCLVLLALSSLFCLSVGSVPLSPQEVFAALRGSEGGPVGSIVMHVRLPRLFAAVLAGIGLAVAGTVIQTVLANPLAGPGIIGVNAGAGLSSTIVAVVVPGFTQLLPLAAFVGALLTMLLVYGVARGAGASKTVLVLAGVAVSSLLTAGINALTTLFPQALLDSHAYAMGGFAGVSLSVLPYAGTLIVLGSIVVLALAEELEILGLGEASARSLGLNVGAYRFLFLLLGAALAGAAVSFAGLIGFVGLIIPHVARLLVGSSRRKVVIASALIGASFLMICDTIARTVFSPFELPVGILIAFIGVPFFLWLLFKQKRRARD
ncbi:MAG: iron ABC transporter permease [Coriobacteriales bacterium]|jgi:iron complex transport system permease protein|nr:iron ABC transporter permease [Coriobacteriales bacterium]